MFFEEEEKNRKRCIHTFFALVKRSTGKELNKFEQLQFLNSAHERIFLFETLFKAGFDGAEQEKMQTSFYNSLALIQCLKEFLVATEKNTSTSNIQQLAYHFDRVEDYTAFYGEYETNETMESLEKMEEIVDDMLDDNENIDVLYEKKETKKVFQKKGKRAVRK